MIGFDARHIHQVAVLGAHCDDIAIGAGGTLLTLAAQTRTSESTDPLEIRALVLAGEDSAREIEERHALSALCPGADIELQVLDVPDGHAPGYWEPIKFALESFRRTCEPDLVFAPHRHNAHHDHRLLAELTPTVFRDHLILGYELLDQVSATPPATIFHPLTHAIAKEKARILLEHYPSPTSHDWFDELALLGHSRLRGTQCLSPHAEAFVVEKATVRFGKE